MAIAGIIDQIYLRQNLEINQAIIDLTGIHQGTFLNLLKDQDYNYGHLYDLSHEDLAGYGIKETESDKLKRLLALTLKLYKRTKVTHLQAKSPSSLAAYYMPMKYNNVEEVRLVCLDTKHHLIGEELLSLGTIDSALMDPREIFLLALRHHARSVVIVHNHPSGDPEPSTSDIKVTKRLDDAGHLLGLPLLDHIIIGDGRYVSMKELGYL